MSQMITNKYQRVQSNALSQTASLAQKQNTPLFLKEKGSATCQTGVLYNRCGMLSLWGGALKTDKNGQKWISVRRRIRLVSPNNKISRFF
ncbi:MAG: hypothetical protein IKC65_08935 [Lentisphaeria bacterium]|nr:hypothetical protein [Lentisphaeria bacterium]